jgi:hypothetical protein
MKRIASWAGLVVVVASMIWPILAVWASGHQLISSGTERFTSLFCYLGALGGAIYHWTNRLSRAPGLMNFALAVLIPVVALACVAWSRGHADQMFAYWMIKRTPQSTWLQRKADIESMAPKAIADGDWTVRPERLPRSFEGFGVADHCWGVNFKELAEGQVAARVSCGGRNRKWGLLVGSPELLQSDPWWSKFRRIEVAANAFFFIGSDW